MSLQYSYRYIYIQWMSFNFVCKFQGRIIKSRRAHGTRTTLHFFIIELLATNSLNLSQHLQKGWAHKNQLIYIHYSTFEQFNYHFVNKKLNFSQSRLSTHTHMYMHTCVCRPHTNTPTPLHALCTCTRALPSLKLPKKLKCMALSCQPAALYATIAFPSYSVSSTLCYECAVAMDNNYLPTEIHESLI